MKKTLLLAAIFSVLASGALDLAVKPLRTNGLKQVVIKDSTVRGVVVPGGSVDLPLPEKHSFFRKRHLVILHFNASTRQVKRLDSGDKERGSARYEAPELTEDLRQTAVF